jgi:hypothetical protein
MGDIHPEMQDLSTVTKSSQYYGLELKYGLNEIWFK